MEKGIYSPCWHLTTPIDVIGGGQLHYDRLDLDRPVLTSCRWALPGSAFIQQEEPLTFRAGRRNAMVLIAAVYKISVSCRACVRNADVTLRQRWCGRISLALLPQPSTGAVWFLGPATKGPGAARGASRTAGPTQ